MVIISKEGVAMEIIISVCKDSVILEQQRILNNMYVNKDSYTEEERLVQSQKLDKLLNDRYDKTVG